MTVQCEMRPFNPQNSAGRKQTEETPQLQTHATFHEKGRMTQSAKSGTLKNYRKALRSNQVTSNVCPPEFQNHYGPMTPLCPLFSPLWTGKSMEIILCISHPCILSV